MKKLLAFFLIALSAIAFNRCNPYDTVTVTDVALNPKVLKLAPEETATLTAIVIPGNATIKSVIWTSNNPSVATVDDTGKVKAVGGGTATITATTIGGGKEATCKVTVMGTLEFTVGGVTFNMVPVEAGTFYMGDAGSTHQVTLTQDYWMGKYEVTQGLWMAVMSKDNPSYENPSYFTSANGYTDDLQRPVECVSWDDICGADGFLNNLNTKLATELGGMRFVLPTEAQWEFAARGGNSSSGYTYAGDNDIDKVAWYWDNISEGEDGYGTQSVGTRPAANELGVFDMSGNVWEWCADRYGAYGAGQVTDPKGPETGSGRILRGGSWYSGTVDCSLSRRYSIGPASCYIDVGLRLALVVLP